MQRKKNLGRGQILIHSAVLYIDALEKLTCMEKMAIFFFFFYVNQGMKWMKRVLVVYVVTLFTTPEFIIVLQVWDHLTPYSMTHITSMWVNVCRLSFSNLEQSPGTAGLSPPCHLLWLVPPSCLCSWLCPVIRSRPSTPLCSASPCTWERTEPSGLSPWRWTEMS